ncbi:hypothetical protein [Stutzerimonas xanthomarina]|uniref:hypothetical protein n=1 Tax=Stutzerimonas xanthomarina TaxID=271420 RepID=UPI003AA88451
MNGSEWLQACIEISSAMDSPALESDTLSGSCALSQKVIDILVQLENADHFLDRNSALQKQAGTTCDISIDVPRSLDYFFAKDWSDLLTTHGFTWRQPEKFFVLDGWSHARAKTYHNIITLSTCLKRIADHIETSPTKQSLIYLGKNKVEVPIQFSERELSLDLEDAEYFDQFTSEQSKHKSQRSSIVKASLTECIANDNEQDRFTNLLHKFDTFIKSVKHGYALYVSEFSYEKTLEEARKAKLDFNIRINKLISEMQNQLLAIPAIFIFIGAQFKAESSISAVSASLFIGTIIFGVLMSLLVRNQRDSMQAIDSEISSEKTKHSRISRHIERDVEEILKPLRNRTRQFYWKMWIIELSVSTTIIFALELTLNNLGTSILGLLSTLGTTLLAFVVDRYAC